MYFVTQKEEVKNKMITSHFIIHYKNIKKMKESDIYFKKLFISDCFAHAHNNFAWQEPAWACVK